MGYNPYEQPNAQQPLYPDLPNTNQFQQGKTSIYNQSSHFLFTLLVDFNNHQAAGFNQNYAQPVPQNQSGYQYPQPQFANSGPGGIPKIDVLGQPIIQDIAMQYGQQVSKIVLLINNFLTEANFSWQMLAQQE